MRTLRVMTVLALIALAVGNAHAATNTWNKLVSGNASGSWATAANPPWSSGALPGATDTANFNTLDITADSTVTLDGNQSINALIFGDTTTSSAANWILSAGTPSSSALTLGGTAPTITVNALGTGKAATISAVLAGTAGLTKAGAGTLILTGTNTFSGATTNLAGTLQIGDGTSATATAGTGALTNASTLTLNLNAAATLGNSKIYNSGTIQNSGVGKVTITNDAAIAGTINGGTAGIVLATKATVDFNAVGDITWSFDNGNRLPNTAGTTWHITANSSCWQFGGYTAANPLSLDIASGATISAAAGQAGSAHYFNNLTGLGNVLAVGNGGTVPNYYVLGNSTMGGTLTVGNNGLSFGNGGATGTAGATTIANGSTVTFNCTSNNTYSGLMGGAGVLVKTATNTLTITGANSYSGGTIISAGILQIGDGGSLGSGTVSNAAVLAVNNTGVMTLGISTIQGSGSFVKAGVGSLTLTGISAYIGSLTVSGGTLLGGTGGSCYNSFVNVADGATNGIQALIYNGQWTCTGLTYAGGTPGLAFDMTTLRVSTALPPLQVNGDLTNNATVNVSVRNGYWPAAGTYPLLGYTGSLIGSGSFTLTGLPSGVSATLNNNTGVKRLELVVTAVPTVSQSLSVWTNLISGNASGAWGPAANWSGDVPNAADTVADFSTLNITATSYVNNDTTRTIGTLRFADTTASHNWYLTNSALTLATSLGQPVVTVSNNTAQIDCAVTGTQGFYKDGAGTLTLTSTNNVFSGPVIVGAGTLTAYGGGALLKTPGAITVSPGAVLAIDGAYKYIAVTNALYLSGSGIGTSGALTFGNNQSINGPITLLADSRITFSANCSVSAITAANKNLELFMNASQYKTEFSGGIDLGTGLLTLNSISGGDIANGYAIGLNAANTYSGGTILTNYATVRLGNAGALGSGGVSLYPNSRLELNTYSPTIGGLSGTGGSITDRGAAGTTTLTVAQSGNTTFAGVISNGASRVLALVKTGAGTLALSGTNTYTGATGVSNGTLCVNGALGNTAVTVASNAVLSAGLKDGVGQASLGGTLTFQNNSLLAVDVAAGTADKISVSGNVTVGSTVQLVLSGDQTRGMSQIVVESTTGSLTGDFVLVNGAKGVTLTKAGAAVWLNIPPKGTLIRIF
ncbi:MAG: autotransporter-associated beta strand repeat-containing protein [bacterium]